MADLMTETNYLNPDVEVIAEINTQESFESFANVLNTGHGVVGTTHAEDVETLVNRTIEQGVPPYPLRELDLVVFPRHVDGERYVGDVVELVSDPESTSAESAILDAENTRTERANTAAPPVETVRKDGDAIHFQRVVERTPGGEFTFVGREHVRLFDRLAAQTDRPVEAVHDEFERKRRYVEYLEREDVSDFETLFGLLSDLQTDETATVERLQRRAGE